MGRAVTAMSRSSAAATTTAEPTLEQLRLAYRQLSNPNRWPPFEAAVDHPVYGTCLRALARNLGRPRWRPVPVAVSLPRGQPVPPTPTQPPVRQQARTGPHLGTWARRGIDLKRAAANDRDD